MDRLITAIMEKQNPTALGLDTRLEYVPQTLWERFNEKGNSFESCARIIYGYNQLLIDALRDIVPCVKVQLAYYEMYSYAGLKAFYDTCAYAKASGLYVIADGKRNDIGATAEAYGAAYLGKTNLAGDSQEGAFFCDGLTINGYLGSDGILPFKNNCSQYNKTAFVLVKTSNPSSGELQDLTLSDGRKVYEAMADMVEGWGRENIGAYGYSNIGAVVGATYKKQAAELRRKYKNMFFLIPGYGAQGAGAEDIEVSFDSRGLGGIVNASRSILCAYKKPEYSHLEPEEAARKECERMREDIVGCLKRHKKWDYENMGVKNA